MWDLQKFFRLHIVSDHRGCLPLWGCKILRHISTSKAQISEISDLFSDGFLRSLLVFFIFFPPSNSGPDFQGKI